MNGFKAFLVTVAVTLGLGAVSASAATMTSASAVSLAVEQPEVSIFVSYPGRLGDQCGLRLVVLDDFGIITKEMIDNLVVKADNTVLTPQRRGNSVVYDFSSQVLPNQLFGIYVTVETADGENLSTLSRNEGKLLAVSTPCPAEE